MLRIYEISNDKTPRHYRLVIVETVKTCPALRTPTHGRMRCQNDEDQHLNTENTTTYPIDSRCQFRCETGYQLRGSKIRNCLPLSQWDGLKATCKGEF